LNAAAKTKPTRIQRNTYVRTLDIKALQFKAVNNSFVQLCRELELFGGKLIGIDGSFFNGEALVIVSARRRLG